MLDHARQSVLIADDDEDDRAMARDAHGESVMSSSLNFVEDGEELLEYLQRRGRFASPAAAPRPTIILLDLNMPRLDGRAALRAIKADLELRDIPVLVFTTSKAETDIAECYAIGASSFLVKPSSYDGLVAMMNDVARYWFDVVSLPLATDAT